MGKTLQIKGGTTDKVNDYTGSERELIVDTDKQQLVVQDGKTKGGIRVPSNLTVAVQDSIMSKAQFETMVKERNKKYGGSGVINGFKADNEDGGHKLRYTDVENAHFYRRTHAGGYDNNLGIQCQEHGSAGWNMNIMGVEHFLNAGYRLNFNNVNDAEMVVNDSSKSISVDSKTMFILDDTDREIEGFISLGSTWVKDSDRKIHSDEASGAGCIVASLIPGIEYEIHYNLEKGDASFYYNNRGWRALGALKSGVNTMRFVLPMGCDRNAIQIHNPSEDTVISEIYIKQVKPDHVFTLNYIEADSDIYEMTDSLYANNDGAVKDIIILESWHEDVSEKDFVYRNGDVQDRGSYFAGKEAIEGNFSGADKYSLLGEWQEGYIGKGLVWSKLTDNEKINIASDPKNNIYLDGEKVIQVRTRFRILAGQNNLFTHVSTRPGHLGTNVTVNGMAFNLIKPRGKRTAFEDYTKEAGADHIYTYGSSLSVYHRNDIKGQYTAVTASGRVVNSNNGYEGKCYALPIAAVQRRNLGIYHETLNPNGSAKVYNDGAACFWYEVNDDVLNTVSDCFNRDLIATVDKDDATNASRLSMLDDGTDDPDTYKVTGRRESNVSGRPDGYYVSTVYDNDVIDLRMSSIPVDDKKSYLNEELNKVLTGSVRTNSKKAVVNVNARYLLNYVKVTESFGGSHKIPVAGDTVYLLTGRQNENSIGSYFCSLNNSQSELKPLGTLYDKVNNELYILGWDKDYMNYGSAHIRMYKSVKDLVDGNFTSFEFTGSYDDYSASLSTIYLHINVPHDQTVNSRYREFTQIIGDTRKLKDRVDYTTTSGDDQEQEVLFGTYIKADGKFYRSLNNRDTIVIDPDTEDYSDSDNWKDLGDDENRFGLTDSFVRDGINFTPVSSFNGKSTLPIDRIEGGVAYGYIEVDGKISSSTTYPEAISCVAYLEDGTRKVLRHHPSWDSAKDGNEIYWFYHRVNGIGYGLGDDIELGINGIVKITYADYSDVAHNDSRNKVLAMDNVHVSNYFGNNNYGAIVSSLINKPATNTTKHSQTLALKVPYVHTDMLFNDSTNLPGHLEHTNIGIYSNPTTNGCKFIPYLTTDGEQAALGLAFTELKFSDIDPSRVKFDTGYIKQGNPINSDNPEYILNLGISMSNNGQDGYDLEIFIGDQDITASADLYVQDYNEDEYTLIGNLSQYLVYRSGLDSRFKVNFKVGRFTKIKIVNNGGENIYVEQVRVTYGNTITPKSYHDGDIGDDNIVHAANNSSTRNNIYGKKVVYGNKQVLLKRYL